MIPLCNFVGKGKMVIDDSYLPGCHLFRPLSTDRGICQSFNAISTTQIMGNSEFEQAFTHVFGADFKPSSSPLLLKHVLNAGSEQGLTFYLNKRSSLKGETMGEK